MSSRRKASSSVEHEPPRSRRRAEPEPEVSEDEVADEDEGTMSKHGWRSFTCETRIPLALSCALPLFLQDEPWSFTQTQAEPIMNSDDTLPKEDPKYKMLVRLVNLLST